MADPNTKHVAFNLSTGADTGGAAIRSVEAFRAQDVPASDWTVRAMVAATNYIAYPQDLAYSRLELELQYDHADVVHLNHTLHGLSWYDAGQHKPIVLEHHGLHKGSFDIDFEGSIQQGLEVGAVQVGSTANLELFGPPGTIVWTPIPYDLAWLGLLRHEALQRRRRKSKVIRIGHAPTDRTVKSTAAFLDAIEQLQKKGLKVEGVLIERQSHASCLALKATVDVLVDQLVLGYGCNAIEAWGMGIPVVGGISDAKWREFMAFRWQSMALFEANELNLADRLQKLVISAELRAEYAEIGYKHVQKWHSQAFHVQQMSEIYANAQPTRTPANAVTRRLTLPLQTLPQSVSQRHAERLALLRANRARIAQKGSDRAV